VLASGLVSVLASVLASVLGRVCVVIYESQGAGGVMMMWSKSVQTSRNVTRQVYALWSSLLLGLSLSGHALAQEPSSETQELTTIQCPAFANLKSHYEQTFIAPMINWSHAELSDATNRPVLYLFSGPDVVTALSLFPTAPHITLVADQIPEYQLLEKDEKVTEAAEQRECGMLGYFATAGFYQTNDLNGKDGARPRFIKLLTYSLGFAGATIVDVSVLGFNNAGELVSQGHELKPKPVGLRFKAVRDDGRLVVIDYLSINLANGGLSIHSASLNFLKQNLNDVLFLKSASHLLQTPSFSVLADLIRQSPPALLVQDETGLSVKELHELYTPTLYGQFTNPQVIWANDPEARAFIDEFATHPIKAPLPFRLGYKKKAGSALIVGRRLSAPKPPATTAQTLSHPN
jgi:hypothetical protein